MEAVVLCGGKSRRMGRDKAALSLGGERFLKRIVDTLSRDFPVVAAVGENGPYPELGCPQLPDSPPDCGPLGGLRSALERGGAETFFVVACDMPFATGALGRALEARLTPGVDAIVPIDAQGRRHPLCAVYRLSALSAVTAALEAGCRRVEEVLDRLRICYWDVRGAALERQLTNVNTPEDYRRLTSLYRTSEGIPVFAVAGYSGVGKTTFLEKLIPRLKERGLTVAVVKHDTHGYELDREGRDSWRLTRAGADVTGLVGPAGAALMENRPPDARALLDGIRDVDVILTEGFKNQVWPKLLVYRAGAGKPPALDAAECLAVVGDAPVPGAARQVGLEDARGAAELILEAMGWRDG